MGAFFAFGRETDLAPSFDSWWPMRGAFVVHHQSDWSKSSLFGPDPIAWLILKRPTRLARGCSSAERGGGIIGLQVVSSEIFIN